MRFAEHSGASLAVKSEGHKEAKLPGSGERQREENLQWFIRKCDENRATSQKNISSSFKHNPQ